MHIHGGDIYSRKIHLDFSANLNFLGMPESVVKAACEGVLHSDHYPDVECRALRDAISRKDGISSDWILCGNGAAELIFALAASERPKLAVLCAPTFYEYEQALQSVGCEIRRVFLSEEEEFAYSEKILSALTPEVDIFVLCNPNNPTGQLMSCELGMKIAKRCREYHIRWLLDECFIEFIEQPDQYSMIDQLEQYPEIFLLRAFTKIYAMAGLRLGYAVTSDKELYARIKLCHQPWNVSVPAQYAGVAAVKETAYVEKYRQLLTIERSWLTDQLKEMGIRIYGSHANYLFFRGPEGLAEQLLRRGIAIRDCSNYVGLSGGYYRIAVRSREENEQLIAAWKELLREK